MLTSLYFDWTLHIISQPFPPCFLNSSIDTNLAAAYLILHFLWSAAVFLVGFSFLPYALASCLLIFPSPRFRHQSLPHRLSSTTPTAITFHLPPLLPYRSNKWLCSACGGCLAPVNYSCLSFEVKSTGKLDLSTREPRPCIIADDEGGGLTDSIKLSNRSSNKQCQ